ncbi:hypothetical protein B0H13DRAFT_2383640 [Mycena leptocephala]|nr:hypothetical protein B0H13DRAFT_2383640 [Mycena leptocephala]
MPTDYLTDKLPWNSSLALPLLLTNALALTCQRLQKTSQHSLEVCLTPGLGKDLLFWVAAASLPHIKTCTLVLQRKLSTHTSLPGLLDAITSPPLVWIQDAYPPLHLAVEANDLAMAAPRSTRTTDPTRHACMRCTIRAHRNFDMATLHLARGATLELHGHNGTVPSLALYVRVGAQHGHVVLGSGELFLQLGAKTKTNVPLSGTWMCGLPEPHSANVLYLAMGPWG